MAKNGLGKGLGALLSENQAAKEEVDLSVAGGIHNLKVKTTSKSDNIPDVIEVDENGGLWLDPALLKPNPKQPRTEFKQKELEELCDSIKENGILQPIVIEQAGEKEFYIIAGERRTRASKW